MPASPTNSRALAVGAAMLVFLSLLLAATLLIHGGAARDTRPFVVYLPDAAGLASGSPIRVNGARAGYIAALAVENSRARTTLAVDRTAPLFAGATARPRPVSLLGGRFLEIDPGSPDAAPLADNAEILAAPAGEGLDDAALFFAPLAGRLPPLWREGSRAADTLDALHPLAARLPELGRKAGDLYRRLERLALLRRRALAALDRLDDVPWNRAASLLARWDAIKERAAVVSHALGAFSGERRPPMEEKLKRLAAAAKALRDGHGGLAGTVEAASERLLLFDERFIRGVLQEQGVLSGPQGGADARLRELEQRDRSRP
ncbi:MAG: MCE family protein [Myxococcales bacterium]|nr:MAG: MCE family protein [Myxococcales bacterium]